MTRKEELLKRIKELRIKQRDIIIKEDRREISTEDYEKQIEPVEKDIREVNDELLKILYKENQERWVEPNKAQEKVDKQLKKIKEAQGIKQGRKRESTSWLSLVIKALMMKETKNIDDVVKMVNKWRPGRERDKTEHQIKVTIYRVKKQYPGPYQEYVWDEEKYQMESKKK